MTGPVPEHLFAPCVALRQQTVVTIRDAARRTAYDACTMSDIPTQRTGLTPDPTAWSLHAALHKALPQARCILHTHMHSATVLCCLKDFAFLMLDHNACRFHQRIACDRSYAGMALDTDEGTRVAAKACRQWNDYPTHFSELHFNALQNILNLEEPDYQT